MMTQMHLSHSEGERALNTDGRLTLAFLDIRQRAVLSRLSHYGVRSWLSRTPLHPRECRRAPRINGDLHSEFCFLR